MKPIFVIADDLTGAAEIGGIAWQHGLSVQILIEEFHPPDGDVLIVDTESRHLSPPAAAERIASLLNGVEREEFALVYKKTDSMMRGPVLAELMAASAALGFGRSLFIPQNPSRRRVVQGGNYFIDDIPLHRAPAGADPHHPPATSDVCRLLDPSGRAGVSCREVGHAIGLTGITIGATQTEADVQHWASQLSRDVLPAGSADFFTAILKSHRLEIRNDQSFSPRGKSLIVAGSASAPSRQWVELLKRAGHRLCCMPEAGLSAWKHQVDEALAQSDWAITAVDGPVIAGKSQGIRNLISELVVRVHNAHQLQTIFIEGGSTAAGIVERFGWKSLRVISQPAPGIVAVSHTLDPAPVLVLKPGTYPWPPNLLPIRSSP